MMNSSFLYQSEATDSQYIFSFVLMNIIFLLNYLSRKNYRIKIGSWLWILVFCLFAYWDTDYFTFREIFYTSLDADFRDPLYYSLSLLSFNSYTVFRLYIWGTATLLLYKTAQRLHLDINMYAFVFTVFFLLLFSYARASLGFAMYFYGLSCLLYPNRNKTASYIKALIFICCSYFGHRSMAMPILLTPLVLVKFNKYTIYILLAIGLVLGHYANSIIAMIIEGGNMGASNHAAIDALESYSGLDEVVARNWKYALTENLKQYAIIIAYAYSTWKCFISKECLEVADWCKRLLNVCTGIFVVAISFLLLGGLGAQTMGNRFLYILGIPMTIIITYLYSNKFYSTRILYFILLPMILFSESYILGKILS